jgi:tetratricopeptide (TPR) repeat protein
MPLITRPACAALAAALAMTPLTASASVDLQRLWNFNDPAASEQVFRAALMTARGDDALVLWTQVARSFGLRKDFERARGLLAGQVQPHLQDASSEVRIRYHLEWGRTWCSATHSPESQTPEAKAQAQQAYQAALDEARRVGLDGLAIDAVHMFAFVNRAPQHALHWADEALTVVLASTQPEAKLWEASVRNNRGMALHDLGRLNEALRDFERAQVLREQLGDPQRTRIAQWMVAWTLRNLKRFDEALDIQSRLERENDDAGSPDPHVYDELWELHRALGQPELAKVYQERSSSFK